MPNEREPAEVDARTAERGFFDEGSRGLRPDGTGVENRFLELEARYRGLIDRLPAVIYLDGVGPDDTMIDVGPGIVDLFGVTREEWIATPEVWRDFLHPADRDRIAQASERSVETGEAFSEQYRALRPDGRVVWSARRRSWCARPTTRPCSGSV